MAARPSGSAFRKKGTVLTPGASPGLRVSPSPRQGPSLNEPYAGPQPPAAAAASPPGVRASPVDGRPTTSTGTASLDGILAGHGGLPLGTSLLLGEEGTTDFAGVLLRYYAAEGLAQGHAVHVVGAREPWLAGLPGLAVGGDGGGRGGVGGSVKGPPTAGENLKIAWRYGALASAGAQRRDPRVSAAVSTPSEDGPVFCHAFDLSQRLKRTSIRGQTFIYPRHARQAYGAGESRSNSSLEDTVMALTEQIRDSSPTTIHRIVINSLLSPGLHDRPICEPPEVLRFLHILRATLRTFSGRTSAMITMPLYLHPRSSGLVRWMEILCDGSIQLVPLPRAEGLAGGDADNKGSGGDDKMQGILRVHSLPVYHEKGGGGSVAALEGDMSFSLSRTSGLRIQPLSLPPLSDGTDDSSSGPSKPPEDF